MGNEREIVYVTSSEFKREENAAFAKVATLSDGVPVSSLFRFSFRDVRLTEILEVDIAVMVQEEAAKAYSQIRIPCIVEHAGLVFQEYADKSYPGGLTKPMWNALGDRFIDETKSAGRKAIARAVVAYCDGKSIRTFTGETKGTLADAPRGHRRFYWDTVFIPDELSGKAPGKTYAEICEDAALGLEYKMAHLSQSAKAMLKFLEYLRSAGEPELWA